MSMAAGIRVTSGTTAPTAVPLQPSLPSLIWTTLTRASVRNPQPSTEPTAEARIPPRSSARLTRTWPRTRPRGRTRRIACLRQSATRLEKRKEAKERTWKETRSSSTRFPAAQSESGRPPSGDPDEGFQARPTNTAKVKREFTLTMPSRAVMWMLVPPPPPASPSKLRWITSPSSMARGIRRGAAAPSSR